MKIYRVLLRGENFLLNIEESVRLFGFYTTRFVESLNEDDAEQAAVDLIRNDRSLRDRVLNAQADPPMLYAEEIDEIYESAHDGKVGGGYTFYEQEPKADGLESD